MKTYLSLFISFLFLIPLSSFAIEKVDMNFSVYYKKPCNSITFKNFGDDWCNQGNDTENRPTLVLIGDSYSNALTTFLDSTLLQNKNTFTYQQFARGQCPSLIGYGPEYCREITEAEINFVKAHPEIKNIALAADWEEYFLGKNFKWVNYQATQQQFMESLILTVNTFRSLGKNVVIILSPPISRVDPHTCLSRGINNANEKNCILPLKQVYLDQTYREFLLPIAQKKGIKVFDPVKYFCNKEDCKLVNSDKVYFVGASHLSGNGGAFLSNSGGDDFVRLLK
jgi:SGNH domain (fused to AT3 domains)